MSDKIEGGYILLARNIIESQIWQKPPEYLKIWVYILSRVNWNNSKKNPIGSDYFNFRQEKIPGVTLNQVYDFLRWAKKENSTDLTTQITTQKTTRGIYLQVTKYAYYQDVNNYCYQDRKRQTFQHITNTIPKTGNNISNTSYINISLSSKKITKEEREILNNYVERKHLAKSSVRAYVNAMIKNGDYLEILEAEKKKQAIRKEKEEKAKLEQEKQEEASPEEIERQRLYARSLMSEEARKRLEAAEKRRKKL